MRPDELRWGILGTAHIADAFLKGLAPGDAGRATAVASRDPERARAWAAERGIPLSFGSYQELLDSGEVDLLYIPLPNNLHAEWAIKGLERGLPVLCEKPFAASAEEAARVASVARRTGLAAAEAFMYRHHPQWEVARACIAEGRLGRLVTIRCRFTHPLGDQYIVQADPTLAGGVLMDLGCYGVHAARLLTGREPLRVMGFEHRTDADRTFVGVMEFPNDLLAHFEASFEGAESHRVEVVGTNGRLLIDRPWHPRTEGERLRLLTPAGEELLPVPDGYAFHLQARCFVQAVTTGTAHPYGSADAVRNMAVIDALYKSSREGVRCPVHRLPI